MVRLKLSGKWEKRENKANEYGCLKNTPPMRELKASVTRTSDLQEYSYLSPLRGWKIGKTDSCGTVNSQDVTVDRY
jgi:hypothetical protein